MAWVKDTLNWAADTTAFKLYAGITGVDANRDARLAQWYLEATWQADYYMENEFLDDDGVDISPQPPGVKTGVWEYVIASNNYWDSGADGAKKSVKTGQLAETYATGSGGAPSPMGEVALRAAAPHWKRNQIDLLKSGVL